MNILNYPFNQQLSRYRALSLYLALIFILLSLFALFSYGLNLGLDFTGGYLTEFSTQSSINQQVMEKMLTAYLPGEFKVSSGQSGTFWSVQQADNNMNLNGTLWLTAFAEQSGLIITPQDALFIGSQVGEELVNQRGLALLTSIIVILLYLSFRFEWRLAAGAVLALAHDVIITLGVFSLMQIEVDLTIVAALLTVVGYSLNDTIVVFDRIRENFRKMRKGEAPEVLNSSITQTLSRTLITSGTTLFVVIALFVQGGAMIHGFATALLLGITVGTYSSIYVASALAMKLGITREHLMPPQVEKEGEEFDEMPYA